MKVTMISFLLLFIFNGVAAQVSGKFLNSSRQPIAFANISLVKSSDSSFVKAVLTDDMGAYKMENIMEGRYMLRFSAVGYLPWESPVFECTTLQAQKDFGEQIIMQQEKQLAEVVVRAGKPPLYQQKPDGMVVNVESSLMSKGSSALQVLERSPGVVIDYRNNSIALNGKSGVTVMINGKMMRIPLDQLVAMLNGMSADNIEKIELLSTPGARYDADGNAGIINIILKKNKKQGTNGSASVTGGYGWGEKAAANFNIAHNSKKVDVYGSYSFLHDKTYSDIFITSTQDMPLLGGKMEVLVWDTTHALQNNHDFTAGIDIRLNPKTTIGANINGSSSKRASADFNHADYRIFPDSLLFYDGIIKSESRWKNLVSSIYAERKIREGELINFSIDYLYYKNDNPSEVVSDFLNNNGTPAGNNDSLFSPRQRGFANTDIKVSVAKLDYTKQLNKKMKLEAGLKGTFTRSNSASGIQSFINGEWVGRNETIDNIVMKEGIAAAYASVNTQVSTTVNLTVGMRYEYSSSQMNNPKTKELLVDRKRGVFFPAISLSKKLNDNEELQLSFSKRISRPSYSDLASFVRYSDPVAVYSGNPLLKPTITNNLKLGYNYKGYNFSLVLSREEYPIVRYQITESPQKNLLYVSPQNLAYQNIINAQVNIPVKVNDWWNMNYSFTGGPRQFKVEHTPQPVRKTYFGFSFNFNQSFKLPKKFSAELSGWYSSQNYNGSIKAGGIGAVNAGIKKELNNNRGSFQLTVNDIFRTMHIDVYYGTLTQEVFSIKNHVSVNFESQTFPVIKLSYSKSFGMSKSRRKVSVGSEDERERARN